MMRCSSAMEAVLPLATQQSSSRAQLREQSAPHYPAVAPDRSSGGGGATARREGRGHRRERFGAVVSWGCLKRVELSL